MKYNRLSDNSSHGNDERSLEIINLNDKSEQIINIAVDNEENENDQENNTEIECDWDRNEIQLLDNNNSNSKSYLIILYEKLCIIWSTIFFSWMRPLLRLGNIKPLESKDLIPLFHDDTSEYIYHLFRKSLLVQNTIQNENNKPNRISLPWILMNSYGKPFLLAGVLKLIHDTCLFIGPVLLNRIIIYIKSPDQPLSLGLFYVIMLFLSQISMALCLRQYFWWCYRVGMRLRSSVITSVFNKSLDISSSVLFKRSTGEITNLMSVDSTRLQDLTPYLHAIWYSFYQIAIALTLLWLQLGAATLAGTFVIVAAIPLTRYVSSYLKSIQKKLSKARDNRVKICNEVFIGIKVIKFQSWEEKYSLKILAARQVELDLLRQYMIGQSIASALYISIPLLVSISTFTTYTLLGNKELDVSTTLTSLALFDLLRFPLYMLPNVLNNLIEAKISIDRLESFYNEPDRNIVPCINMRGNSMNNHNKYYPCILIKNASFVWDSSTFKKKRIVKHSIILRGEDNLFRKFQLFFIKLMQASGLQNEIVRNNESVIYVDKSDEEFTIDVMNCIQSETNILIDQLEYKLAQLNQSNQSLNDNPVGIVTSSYPLNDSVNDTYIQKRDILTLFRINLTCCIGQLTGIVGCVGSGKSSMLSAILGDIKLYNGSIHLDSSSTTISYVSQRPFIQNSTLRENILFGNKYNETLYNQVLFDCCLLQDLSILPAGDLTEIGERGINISGGQKSRIALARSLYANNSIYILDDPLSAVDAHVGQYLFDNVILKLKRLGKCVVLVTNAIQYIKFMDNVVVLDNGRITQHGSYCDLMNDTNGLLCQMMSSYNETLRQSEDTDNLKIKDSNVYDNNIVEVKLNANASIVNGVDISKKVGDGKLITVEDREVGDVNINVYVKWLESSGGIIVGFMLLFLCIANESSNILGQWWISQLSQSFSTKHHTMLTSKWFHLVIYVLINIFVIAIVVSQELYIRTKSLNSSKKLFSNMLERILYTPMSFYDTTPIGRISNRFIKDIYTIDEQLPQTIRSYSGNIIKICSVLLYISIITPLFLILLLPIMLFYYYSQRYYIKTSRELSRLDSVSRSPIYAMFSETLDGLTTIRAYCKEDILRKKLYNLLNNNQNAYFLNFSANCWLGIRLDCVGAFIVSFTALCAILAKQNILYNNFNQHEDSTNNKLVALAALSGLAISLSLNCTQSLNWSVRMASDLESQMISVERINMFTQLEQESSHHKQLDNTLVHWPSSGVIEMINVSMRYRDNLPYVLKNINLLTRPKEKIGIVGRTGSGKSSLVSILLRLVEISEGIIKIDGIDTSSIGLHKLRSNISVIPQDPLLFSGTLRNNLDPFNTYTDSSLYHVLQNCQLNEFSLDLEIEENGNNLSIGQKQLICIARALVCSSKIIIMDEATAAIDIQTDNLIQKTMKEQFSQCTCLTIAHRLNTILDSDRVLVMSDGNIIEFDTPNQLLQQKSSAFAKLVNEWDSSSS